MSTNDTDITHLPLPDAVARSKVTKSTRLRDAVDKVILAAYILHSGHQHRTAKYLGISHHTVHDWRVRYFDKLAEGQKVACLGGRR